MKNIFDEMTLNKLKLKNRLFRSATWLASADEDGNLTEPIFDTYRELAKGGVAAIVTGITTVSPHDAYLDGIVNRWQSGNLKPSACIGCNMCYRTPGHKCIFVLRGKK